MKEYVDAVMREVNVCIKRTEDNQEPTACPHIARIEQRIQLQEHGRRDTIEMSNAFQCGTGWYFDESNPRIMRIRDPGKQRVGIYF